MTRRFPVLLGALLCAACAAAPAAAASSISGSVTAAASGAPLAEVIVCAESVGVTDVFECAETVADGGYLIAGLEGANYKVKFSPSILSGYQAQYYRGKASGEEADLVAVVDGIDTVGIDAALAGGPSGGAGSATVPPPAAPQAAAPPGSATLKNPSPRCRKGWRKVKVKGKSRCRKVQRPRRGGAKRAA